RARAAHEDLHAADAVVRGLFRRAVGGLLGRERRALARTFEPHTAGARPRDHIALIIGDRHDRVIESRMNVHDAFGDILAPFFLARGALRSFFLRLAFDFFLVLFVLRHKFSW